MLAVCFCGEFSFTSHGVCFLCFFFKSAQFLLHIPCWLHFYVGSFSYTSRAGFIFIWGVSLTHPVLGVFFFFSSFFLFKSGEFLLHIPCLLSLSLGSFSYTSHAVFIFTWGVSVIHPVLAYTSRADLIFFLGTFSYTSLAGFTFLWEVSLAQTMQTSFTFVLFLILFYYYYYFIWGVSLTHPMLALFLSRGFLLHIPCLLYFSLGSFSYTSFLSGEFRLNIRCCFCF